MSKYVAMLRGIGPGDPNMTKTKFESFFEELGFTSVDVVLSSGNIIFESPLSDTGVLAELIEDALPKKLGFSRSVIIKSELELQRLIESDPFEGTEHEHNKGKYLLVTFFKKAPTFSFEMPYRPDGKPYVLLDSTDSAVYGSIDLTKGRTPDYMAWLEKQFGKDITSRTPKTIRLILSRMQKV